MNAHPNQKPGEPPLIGPRPYKISVLVFFRNPDGHLLLLERTRPPNLGQWSPIGGKLEMATGESPHECAVRETREEIGLEIGISDLHLFSMIAEKAYEGGSHWLMFLFDCRRVLTALPPPIGEGSFAFHTRAEVDRLALPETDRLALWPVYDHYRGGFVALRADCTPGRPLEVHIDESIGLPQIPERQVFRQ